jgi:cold shock CspA family protein/ribosome-associated translation inhibitor RaiA
MVTAMQVPVQIAFHHLECSEAPERLIEEKAAWLERFCDRITSCRVVVEAPHRRHRRGNGYQVRIDLAVPGAEIVVRRDPPLCLADRDLRAAIGQAFDAARRRLEEYARCRRKDVKSREAPPQGRVSRLFPAGGYGFLMTPDGREVYFHHNAVLRGDFAHLRVGAEVNFVEGAGEEGPQASTVRLLGRRGRG